MNIRRFADTPFLRYVALTAPYFHDGSGESLREVIDTYSTGGRTILKDPLAGIGRLNTRKDPGIKGFSPDSSYRFFRK